MRVIYIWGMWVLGLTFLIILFQNITAATCSQISVFANTLWFVPFFLLLLVLGVAFGVFLTLFIQRAMIAATNSANLDLS